MFDISADTLLVRSKSMFALPVDDEWGMMEQTRSLYSGGQLAVPCSQAQMLEQLGEAYDEDLGVCNKELKKFLLQLWQNDLL